MARGITEISLEKALGAARLGVLPKIFKSDDKRFWFRALVLVRKRNGTMSYALAERKGDGVVKIVKDFGLMSPIAGVTSVYPYMFLDETFIPKEGSMYHRIIAETLGLDLDKVKTFSTERLGALARDVAIFKQLHASISERQSLDFEESLKNSGTPKPTDFESTKESSLKGLGEDSEENMRVLAEANEATKREIEREIRGEDSLPEEFTDVTPKPTRKRGRRAKK